MSDSVRICDVDPQPLIDNLPTEWTERDVIDYAQVPAGFIAPIWERVFRALGGGRIHHRGASLNRARPGVTCYMHSDSQPPKQWVTRIHVPLVTNPKAWHRFDGGEKFHMEVGGAYTFDCLSLHDFGNDGETPRIHLMFDVDRSK